MSKHQSPTTSHWQLAH